MKHLKRSKRARGTKGKGPGGGSTPLSLTDLQIPVEPLLTKEQEARAGRRVRATLERLALLLPRHALGYRRYLARMGEVVMGGGPMFCWLTLRQSMERDLKRAARALEKAEALATREPEKAIRALESGVKILRTYPLDPETLFQWSREVSHGRAASSPALLQTAGEIARIPRVQKVHRILHRAVEILERERDRLVLPNFRLVLKEVFRYHPVGMRRSDLFQEGVLGLQKAVFRFDPERSTRFSTYATYWIRQAIRKCLIDKSRMIRVPQAVQEELRKSKSSLSPEESDRVRRIMSETMLFSAAESDESDRNAFVVKDPHPSDAGEELHTGTIPSAVTAALECLGPREREVVQRRFGLGGEAPQTLEEIGNRMNLSRERIRQIEREALNRMARLRELQEVYEDLEQAGSVTYS